MVNDIAVTIVQPVPPFYSIVDKSTKDKTWREDLGTHYLHMGASSGSGGTLRFVCPDNGQSFALTVGIHNYHVWGHIITGLGPADATANAIYLSYYREVYGGTGNPERVSVGWDAATSSTGTTTYGGRTISFAFTQSDTENPKVELSILP